MTKVKKRAGKVVARLGDGEPVLRLHHPDGSGPTGLRVLIVEDEEPLVHALCELVAGEVGTEIVGVARSADEAVELARATRPNVAIVDASVPGGGAEVVRGVRASSSTTRTLALSADEGHSSVLQMLSAGAAGYVVKGASPTEILEAVRRAARGQASLSVEAVSRIVEALVGDTSERRRLDAIVNTDLDGTIETWNLWAERLFGYSAEEVVGRSISLLVPPHAPDDQLEIVDRLRSGKEFEQFEAKRVRKDGVVLDVMLKISAIRDVDGLLVGTSIVARDVTSFKAQAELERERALLAHLLSAGEEERGRIAAGIHDDSIQAITAAGMRLQLLRRTLNDPEQLELLGELEKTIELSILRLRHLLFELRPPALDTDGLSAALELYLAETGSDGGTQHELEDRLSAQPPPETRTMLYRIVQELLANVRNHADAEKATVVLEDRDQGYHVRVSDDGVGFVPDELKPVPGHLGLAAMRERAALAGGWLRIDSAPGKGTTVEVWIPRLPGPGPSDPPSGQAPSNLRAA